MALAAPFPAATAPRDARRARVSSPRRGSAALTTRPASWPSSGSRSGVRLTRRGRAVALLASVVLLLLAVAVSGRVTARAGDVLPAGPATAVVVVQPGETLWQIAKTLAPQGDPRALVAEIRELNGLSDAPVRPGQSLVVPVLG